MAYIYIYSFELPSNRLTRLTAFVRVCNFELKKFALLMHLCSAIQITKRLEKCGEEEAMRLFCFVLLQAILAACCNHRIRVSNLFEDFQFKWLKLACRLLNIYYFVCLLVFVFVCLCVCLILHSYFAALLDNCLLPRVVLCCCRSHALHASFLISYLFHSFIPLLLCRN